MPTGGRRLAHVFPEESREIERIVVTDLGGGFGDVVVSLLQKIHRPLIGISIVAANISTEQMVGMAGQAAGSTGLAVSCWQLLGSVFIVIISMTLLPKFLRAGIYTMPEYLEYRYNTAARCGRSPAWS